MFRKLLITLNFLFVFLMLGVVFASFNFSGNSGFFSFLQLLTPVIFIIHIFFLVFWLFRDWKWSLLSIVTLVIAYFVFGSFYRFGGSTDPDGQISVMSYNVKGFNRYGWIPITDAGDSIVTFFKKENPDILCIQEYGRTRYRDFKQYRFKTETPKNIDRSIQAIFSKFPIVGEGTLNPPGSLNNIIYADILFQRDTIRVYNVHLESFKIDPENTDFSQAGSGRLYKRMLATFNEQLQQAKLLKEHVKNCPFQIVLCGDFNNTQFSNVYRILAKGMDDSFLSVGKGLGKTYSLNGLPMRIDYILTSKNFSATTHRNFNIKYSDHYPIIVTLQLKSP